jgi:hypothetical protein
VPAVTSCFWQGSGTVPGSATDRRSAAADLAEQYRGTVTAEEILESPFLFVGTIEEMAEQIVRNRDRYGFTYYTVREPYLGAFPPVIDQVRALEA